MWVFEEDFEGKKLTEVINEEHENKKYLPDVKLPENVVAVPDLVEAVKGATAIVFVTPHQVRLLRAPPPARDALHAQLTPQRSRSSLARAVPWQAHEPVEGQDPRGRQGRVCHQGAWAVPVPVGSR